MNSFELNKILGALLGTCLVLVAVHIASGAIFTPEPPAKPGYEIAVKAKSSRRRRRARGAGGSTDRDAARQRVGGARRQRRQAMPSLP